MTRPEANALPRLDPGSFRDPNNRVWTVGEEVYRGVSERALRDWRTLAAARFFQRAVADGRIVQTVEAVDTSVTETPGWAAVLKHERVPFISYPYEWSFGMLRDAALLQLDLLLAALDEGLILKDASAYNCQWRGAQPVFIDIPSFEIARAGEPWAGYRQFCQMFLYPLMLQAYKDLAFQPWLRGSVDGVEPRQCRRVFGLRDWLRAGVLLHVVLQSRMQERYADTDRDVRRELRAAGFSAALIRGNVQRLRSVVAGLAWTRAKTEWSDYALQNSYTAEDRARKEAFVRAAVVRQPWKRVWDLGCNTGTFSRIAAENAEYVVALDADPLAIDRLYRRLQAEGNRRILPLIFDVASPSPGLGWRGRERRPLEERGRPELVLSLALIHHVVISANIPLTEFIDWLASLDASIVIEFVARQDPMVQRLLRNKSDDYPDYDVKPFEDCFARAFTIEERAVLGSGSRILYFGRPRAHGRATPAQQEAMEKTS